MNERKQNVAVGLTAVLALAVLAVMLVMFGYVPRALEEGYEVRVEMASSSRLNESSRVQLSGIDIGRVRSVELAELPKRGVVVTALIRSEVRIPSAAKVSAQGPIIGGNPALAFNVSQLTDEQMLAVLPIDGSAQMKVTGASAMDDMVGRMDTVLDRFAVMSERWSEVAENINALVEPRTMAAVDAGEAPANLTVLMQRTDERLRQAEGLLNELEQWLGDGQLHEDIRQTAANARKVSDAVGGGVDKAKAVVDKIGGAVDDLSAKYKAVADDLSQSIRSLGRTFTKADEGEGTAGKLLNDPALYDNLNDAAERLDTVLVEMKLLIEKWKAEGLPVQF